VDTYRNHPSKAGRWDGVGLIPLDDGAHEPWTVWVPIAVDETTMWEGLIAWVVAPGEAQLRSVPAFAYDLNFDDVVSIVESAEGSLVCTGIIRRSGQSTFRVWLGEDGSDSWSDVAANYAKHGCIVEVISPKLLALSCIDESAQLIVDKLAAAQGDATLTFERGRP
jgi:hypothetical protein